MTNGEAVQTFQKLGLSEYESRALATLFGRHDSTALDVSREAEIPYTKIYAVLTSLEKMGLIKSTLERPKKYRPIDPGSALSLVINARESSLNDLKSLAKEKQEILQKVFTEGERYEGDVKAWFLPNMRSVWTSVIELILNSKEHVHVLAGSEIWGMALKEQKIAAGGLHCHENGITAHNIIPASLNVDFRALPPIWLKLLAHENDNMRMAPEETITYEIIARDNELAILGFRNPEGKLYAGIAINDEPIVTGIIQYFNMRWNEAMPVEDKIREAAKQALATRGKKNGKR
jgi:predicted transcriptional regulator